jgi:hypothetical protein
MIARGNEASWRQSVSRTTVTRRAWGRTPMHARHADQSTPTGRPKTQSLGATPGQESAWRVGARIVMDGVHKCVCVAGPSWMGKAVVHAVPQEQR